MAEIKYPAKYGKVWKHIQTKKIAGKTVILAKDEKITDYRQVPKAKNDKEEKPKGPKGSAFSEGGNAQGFNEKEGA